MSDEGMDDADRAYEAMEKRDAADEAVKRAVLNRIAVGNEEAVVHLRSLVNWMPEVGYPHETDACDESADYLDVVPFCSEAYLYNLIGKQDARSFLCYVDALARALGFTGYRALRRKP